MSARGRFKALAAKSQDVSHINIAEFGDYLTAQPWLQVLHDGEQDGIGRRRWKPEQKARATTSKSTDALAVALLDYAERHGIVSGEARRDIQLSTATRYLANPAVRRAMGLASAATSDKVVITTDVERFSKILSDFFDRIKTKRLHSRSITADWLRYASELESIFNAPGAPTAPVDVGTATLANAGQPKPLRRATRAKIVTPETRFITRSAALIDGLNKLGSFKLASLYNSLTSIRLDEHPALLTTGAWVFLETLTALHGRTPGSDFVSYLGAKFGSWGISREQGKECKLSLDYISRHGNAQKHSGTFTAVDARNLNNHFEVLEGVFVALVGECLSAKQDAP